MGNCCYCGHPAGFLRARHKECAQKNAETRQTIIDRVHAAIVQNSSFAAVSAQLRPVAREGFITSSTVLAELVVEGWQAALEAFFSDGAVSEDEEARLMRFARDSGSEIEQQIRALPTFARLAQARVLRAIANGSPAPPLRYNGALPNLSREETLVWAFPQTEYLEDRVRREYVGSSQGVSIRVMRGVSYRIGGFKGRPVEHEERVSLGVGTLFVTDRNLYFTGERKAFRVPYSKIVAFHHYSNGLGVVRDANNAKPQTFLHTEGWFMCNLVGLLCAA